MSVCVPADCQSGVSIKARQNQTVDPISCLVCTWNGINCRFKQRQFAAYVVSCSLARCTLTKAPCKVC